MAYLRLPKKALASIGVEAMSVSKAYVFLGTPYHSCTEHVRHYFLYSH